MNQVSTLDEPCRKSRPGGRTADVTRRINEAILELMAEGGIEHCSFQNVAARAGIERSTLYRRNPDRWPTIMGAIIHLAERETAKFETGSFRTDLLGTLLNLLRVLNSPLGGPLMSVAAALQSGAAPGLAEQFWESRQQLLAPMFEAAIERGELPADIDRDRLFAMVAGPIYFRRFIASQPVTEEWIRGVAHQVCDSFGIPE
ncbi:TetR/AcrR family transcriptional regulator [Sphingomonas sp.]|uniref:TetR/AcrR family transcriptional regulator n=1 Tax=Sphingomonas sp. TaxID=28214 RepID=UPI0025EE5F6B|nr:TetR/AcrR family transcriptional regulator [Sphingomonas sp.]